MLTQPRTVAAAAAAAVSTLALLAAGSASASASSSGAARTGTEHVQIMSTSPTAPATSIASGLFTTAGRAELGNAPVGKLVFPAGTISVAHKPGRTSQHLNLSTCLNSISQTGTYQIRGGTGRYAHVSGHGTYRLSLLFIAARVAGHCSQSKPPTAYQELLQLSGPARL
jgi:glucose/arabinose dehydrogenase